MQDMEVRGGEVGGDDPHRPPGEDVLGKIGGVADHRGDIVAGVCGLAQQLSADASGGSNDRELHGFLLLLASDRSRPVPGTPVGRTPVAIARMTGT